MFDFYCKIASYNLTLKSKRNIRDTLYFIFFFFQHINQIKHIPISCCTLFGIPVIVFLRLSFRLL